MIRLTNSLTRAMSVAALLGTVAFVVPSYAAAETDAPLPTATQKPAKAAIMDSVEKRISQLHGKLLISPAQEGQWTDVAQAMRDNARDMDALIKERSSNAKTMTAIEDLRSYEKLAVAHETGLKTFIPVFQALYDTMSDDQKKVADEVFRQHKFHDGRKKI